MSFNLNMKKNQPQSSENPKEPLQLEHQPSQESPQPHDQASSAASSENNPDWEAVPLPQDDVERVNGEPIDKPTSMPDAVLVNDRYVISYDAFHKGFVSAFLLAGHITQLQTVSGAANAPTCPDATRAIYDTILDTPALHFMIAPGSVWVQRAFAIGSFFVPLVFAVKSEILLRREAAAGGE